MPASLGYPLVKSIHRFVVGLDREGHWIARDEQGLTGGVFCDKTAAVHFAETESNHEVDAISFAPEGVPLSLFH